jgi:membrane fusion protein, heavy metal efflux system
MKFRIAVVFALAVSVLSAVSCNHPPAEASAEHATQQNRDEIVLTQEQQTLGKIETQTINLSDAPEILRVPGRIALADDRTWRVGVRADGIVTAVYANLGDRVEKGQVLARYHADEVREARAVYLKSVAELNRLRAAEALARRMYDRAQLLLNLRAGSEQQVEQARQDLLAAQTATKAAQVEVDRGKDQLEDDLRVPADPPPGTPEEVADNVPIIAPASGYVIEKHVTPGKTIQTTTDSTFVIGDLSQVWMLANVRQETLPQLRLGQMTTVTLLGMSSKHFSGKLTNLGQELDEVTRTMQVRIVLNNPANLLKPEMLANADIPIGTRKPQLLVPADALQEIGDQNVVFVRSAPDRFVIRPVQAGATADGKTPILQGLQPGEQVVVSGSFVLKSQLLKSTVESE